MERDGRSHYHTRASGGGINHRHTITNGSEPDSLLHWGNRKRLLCVKVQPPHAEDNPTTTTTTATTVRVLRAADKVSASATQHRSLRRNSEANGMGMNGVSPERVAVPVGEEKKGSSSGSEEGGATAAVWPKFFIALTTKEKEEDFLVFKGSKPPQRPKKRAKIIQRTVNLVSPGAWLCDLSLERYEVREKKTSKKRPRGLKAMGSMENESE